MLVLDSNVVLLACAAVDGFDPFERHDLYAPAFMWSEARSGLHEAKWRGDVSAAFARETLERLESAPVEPMIDRRVGPQAWNLAEEFGWARTYDAEYVALARILDCRLVTLDRRLRRGADRLGFVIGPDEL